MKELCEQGELGVEYRKGPKCCNVYKISDSLKARQSQGETVSLRSAGSLMVRRRCSQGETQTPRTQGNPNKGANRSRFDTESVPLPFQSEKFSQAWSTGVKHRKEMGHPLTPTATRQQLSRLKAIGEIKPSPPSSIQSPMVGREFLNRSRVNQGHVITKVSGDPVSH